MINRYNIALIPLEKKTEFINFAEHLKNISTSYQLGPHSIPHVTLCQFYANAEDLDGIWRKVNLAINQTSIKLRFESISCLPIDGFDWISLVPNNLDILNEMHYAVANLIETRLGRCFEKFDPHLTLINTLAENYQERVRSLPFISIEAEFFIVLGKSDDAGQLQHLLFTSAKQQI